MSIDVAGDVRATCLPPVPYRTVDLDAGWLWGPTATTLTLVRLNREGRAGCQYDMHMRAGTNCMGLWKKLFPLHQSSAMRRLGNSQFKLLMAFGLGLMPWCCYAEMDPQQAFFEQHCVSCHSRDEPRAEFRLDLLLQQPMQVNDLLAWKEVVQRLQSQDMPPQEVELRPTSQEYEAAIEALIKRINDLESELESQKPRALRRLNQFEYANTIQDLFGIPFRPGSDFAKDDALHGFDTVAEGLQVSPGQVERYFSTAEGILDRVLPEEFPIEPRTRRYAFYEEHHLYPQDAKPLGFGIYNGNATMFFGDGSGPAQGRIAYIGGPAVFAWDFPPPLQLKRGLHEGWYRFKATLIPRKFEPQEVASRSRC